MGDAWERWKCHKQCVAGQVESSLFHSLQILHRTVKLSSQDWRLDERDLSPGTGWNRIKHQHSGDEQSMEWDKHKHTYLQREREWRRELTVYITGEMIKNKVCFYLHWQRLYVQGLQTLILTFKKAYSICFYCIFIINKIYNLLYIYKYYSLILYLYCIFIINT